ncbi:hypothetical protein GF312_20880 [Candidatus Poribacteria bacterium]|nr:hypothetical protein [Candidatus Poribacteria bacterium]
MKIFLSTLIITLLVICPMAFADMVVLFDENTASEAGGGDFPALFPNHDADSVVEISETESFAGSVSVLATPSQSYNNIIEGWEFPVDDYPYLTFAWKKDGGTGIMVQFAFDTTWAYRYYSGVNVTDWPGIQLEDTIPEDWMMYTRNLVDDFGGGWNLTGIALTPWDGEAGYYDFMILHSDPEPPTAVEAEDKLTTTWGKMKSN